MQIIQAAPQIHRDPYMQKKEVSFTELTPQSSIWIIQELIYIFWLRKEWLPISPLNKSLKAELSHYSSSPLLLTFHILIGRTVRGLFVALFSGSLKIKQAMKYKTLKIQSWKSFAVMTPDISSAQRISIKSKMFVWIYTASASWCS